MNMLKELLDDVAEQAKLYDRMDRALAAARRRRRLTRIAPVALTVAVAIGLAAVWLPLHTSPVKDDAAAAISWLPQRLTVPKQSPPPLPTDHGVAPGSLVYRAGHDVILVTDDGRQYSLPGESAGSYVRGISPDGRWLATDSGDKVLLRDLTATAEIQITSGGSAFAKSVSWSPDGQWFALWAGKLADNTADPDVDPRITLVDLGSRKQWTRPAPDKVTLTGVLDYGDVALAERISPDMATPSTPFQLTILDPRTGQVPHLYQIDVGPLLSSKERQARRQPRQVLMPSEPALLTDGQTLLLRPFVRLPGNYDGQGYVPDDVLAIDLDTGRMIRRYDLPDPRIASTKNIIIDHNRTLAAVLPDGVLYVHNGRTSPPGGPISLELLDLASGQIQVVTTVPPDVTGIVAVRGGGLG